MNQHNRCRVIDDVITEIGKQDKKWGQQRHRSHRGVGISATTIFHKIPSEAEAKERCNIQANAGELTWADIVTEEYAEALESMDDQHLYEEIVQLAACCVQWAESVSKHGKEGKQSDE